MTKVPIIIETSSLICRANQCTGFYMIGTFVMKELSASKTEVTTAHGQIWKWVNRIKTIACTEFVCLYWRVFPC